MASIAPLARVKEEFGGKDKLVDKIVALLGSGDEPKDEMRRRLLGAANSKLIRLHRIANQVKEVGGADQLAGAAAAELGHAKDQDYVNKLATYPAGRLIDILESARRRNRRAHAAPAEAAAPGEREKKAAARAGSASTAAPRPAKKAAPRAEAKAAGKAATKGGKSRAKPAAKSSAAKSKKKK
jgi:hypothetical protein